MSKDKGTKNHKKAPAAAGKEKKVSAYKSETKESTALLSVFKQKGRPT
jgi:hypothetical protein